MVAPLVAAAGISAAGSLLGGLFGSSSASKAAKYQLQATREQIAAANQNRDYQYNLNAPTINAADNATSLYSDFLGAGGGTNWGAYVNANPDVLADWNKNVAGTGQYASMADYGKYHYNTYGQYEGRDISPYTTSSGDAAASALDTFRNSTGYQDLVKEGLAAVNSNAYARGMGDSGATLKALQDRGTSLADRSAQGWLGNLGNLINAGSSARGLVAGVGTNTVNSVNQATQSGADASSNAALINGQNWSNVLQNIGNSAAYAYGSSYGGGSGYGSGAAPVYTTPPYAGLRG